MDNKIKHLELIQDIIRRMSSNSFKLKGWAVTLISGIFVLAAKDTEKIFFFIAYLPIIMFWGLDSFYLLQEKGYRALYLSSTPSYKGTHQTPVCWTGP